MPSLFNFRTPLPSRASTLRPLCIALASLAAASCVAPRPKPAPEPIIDMHLHAHPLAYYGSPPPAVFANDEEISWPAADPREFKVELLFSGGHGIRAPATDEDVLRETLEILERRNIHAVTSGPLDLVTRWRAAAPARITPAISFIPGEGPADPATIPELRRKFAAGEFAVFAEIGAQYRGLAPNDPSLEPFFALAEELDIPVGIHMGVGPPGAPYWSDPKYRARFGDPLLLEDVLVKHPRMRLYVMHAGWPLTDNLIALMFSHPQVYVDISCDNWNQPRKEFYRELRRLVEAGFGQRIMFGSDQMVWPKTIEIAIDTIESADFLTAKQKRDIFYNNAARFLRLGEAAQAAQRAR